MYDFTNVLLLTIHVVSKLHSSNCNQYKEASLYYKPQTSQEQPELHALTNLIIILLRDNNITTDNEQYTANVRRSKIIKNGGIIDKSEEKRIAREEIMVKEQHDRKVRELIKFMDEYWVSTNYLYDEMKRILKTRKVKDSLRKMVEYLEDPHEKDIRATVLRCYAKARKEKVVPRNPWDQKTNNMVINVIRDPYNDGYMN
ncbi:hypothetical protein K1T71_013919 [Dendrolimus kikuchii]|uniref:Uncharacterized protein n=1 Tax=Dendrolimus kikuchii TaxID=765133 RepID=A0ACC1CGB0_9NEOP|nr:hypothetical protein K1T71_013919 [Dendrolimus kikuchii]